MNKPKSPAFSKVHIQRSFNEAAASYDQAAFLQQDVCHRLMERLDFIRIDPKVIVDLGSGTGYATPLLQKRYRKAKIIALDLAENMLLKNKNKKRWFDKKKYICADAEQLPIANNSIDLVFCNLMLHWTDNLKNTFDEIQRILKPEGLFLFTTLGPDTLYELKQSWANIDENIHVHSFLDMHDIGDNLLKASFVNPVVDMEFITLTYNDIKKIFLDLKDLGTHNLANNRQKGLTGKHKFQQFIHAYEQYRNSEGLIPMTYEVIYGLGWGARNEKASVTEISIPVSSIQKIKR